MASTTLLALICSWRPIWFWKFSFEGRAKKTGRNESGKIIGHQKFFQLTIFVQNLRLKISQCWMNYKFGHIILIRYHHAYNIHLIILEKNRDKFYVTNNSSLCLDVHLSWLVHFSWLFVKIWPKGPAKSNSA